MKIIHVIAPFLLFVCLFSCRTNSIPTKDDGIIEVTFLQLNDVYEISPAPSDHSGGLARVAGIQRALKAKNPNTITVLAGDFISPSIIGSLRYEGKQVRGKQMIETLNALGVDYVVFGNHEFDFDDQADLQARLDESDFTWFGANARLKSADGTLQPFFKNRNGQKEPCPDNRVLTLKDADGTTLNLGLFGVLINTGKKPWVQYSDWTAAAHKSFDELKSKSDVVVAITHLEIADDEKLSAELPEIPLFIGGHDHKTNKVQVGRAVIAKADENAKTVYVHTIRYDKRTKTTTVKSELLKITGALPDEPATAAVIEKWERIKLESLASAGFEANRHVADLKAPLDCREELIRFRQAPAGKTITEAMTAVCKTKPDCILLNAGSIRCDKVLAGIITELDIVQMLPFGGAVLECDMRGSLLHKTLDTGIGNTGSAGYLQWGMIQHNEAQKSWLVNGLPLDDQKIYHVALPDFMLRGNEKHMGFLKASPSADGKSTTNPDVIAIAKPVPGDKADLRNDVRLAVIQFLRLGGKVK
jgi:2',3'-cyclic-nucleotide 2'-phosphodiesterase (5'-nucleotidase family)